MRRDHLPARDSFNGSGFPIPSKGERLISLIRSLMRLINFFLLLANTNNLPKQVQSKQGSSFALNFHLQ